MRRRPIIALLGVFTVVLGSLIGWQSASPHAQTPGTFPATSLVDHAGPPVAGNSSESTEEVGKGLAKISGRLFPAEGATVSPELTSGSPGIDESPGPDDAPGRDDAPDSGASERGQGLPHLGEPGRPDGEFGPPSSPAMSQQERADRLAGVLGEDVTDGAGTLRILPGEAEAPDPDADRVIDVRIEVEDGLPVDEVAFGAFVMGTLNDERSWSASEAVSFARTDGDAQFRVVLASPDLVDEMCAPLRTVGEYSCGRNDHAALNALRWVQGADAYLDAGGELPDYRRYLVNHEVGHLLGYPHERCPEPGEPAPIMVQQSIDLDGCAPSAWVEE